MKKFKVLIGVVVFILSLSYFPAEVFSAEIIVDNGGTGTSWDGTWSNSSGSGYYGSLSVYTRAAADSYTFEADVNGSSEVYLRWTYHESRCSNVAVDIYDGAIMIDTVYVNQLQDGGQWNKQGTYTFTGTAAVVMRGDGDCSSTSFSVNADAVKFVTSGDPPTSDEYIIDNLPPGQSGSGIAYEGTWMNSSGANYYGSRSVYADTSGATYTFKTFFPGEVRNMEVYQRWTYYNNRCIDTKIEIYDAEELIDTLYVNQKENVSQWNYLDTYQFDGGAALRIISEGGCSVNADAVKFVKKSGNGPGDSCGTGMIYDCDMRCVNESAINSLLGNGRCDYGEAANNYNNLNCIEFLYDNDDCPDGQIPCPCFDKNQMYDAWENWCTDEDGYHIIWCSDRVDTFWVDGSTGWLRTRKLTDMPGSYKWIAEYHTGFSAMLGMDYANCEAKFEVSTDEGEIIDSYKIYLNPIGVEEYEACRDDIIEGGGDFSHSPICSQ